MARCPAWLAAFSALVLAATLSSGAAAAAPATAPPLDQRYEEAAARILGAALSDGHAYDRLAELCDGIGHRLSGSPELVRAEQWAAQAMRGDGLDSVWLQPVYVPHWERGAERAEMTAPARRELVILGLGGSVGTPRGGITADVVAVTSFAGLDSLPDAAVRGRIVLYDVPFTHYGETVRYRFRGAQRAAARGAVAALVRSVSPARMRVAHTGVMAAYPDSLPRIPAAAVTAEDAGTIHRLLDRGERVRVHLEMGARTLPDALAHNVIGELRGRERPEEVVVVGGHLDSWDVGQGAIDDGGGCVISMEALRLLARLGLRPRRTVRCVLWANEENGGRGGREYARSIGAAVRDHVAALESDGGVEAPTGFGLTLRHAGSDSVDSGGQELALARAAEIGRLLAGIDAARVQAGGGGADIDTLMDLGVPGLSAESAGLHYFDWHHTGADTFDKVDPLELRKNLAALTVMVYVLADMPGRLADGAGGEPAAVGP